MAGRGPGVAPSAQASRWAAPADGSQPAGLELPPPGLVRERLVARLVDPDDDYSVARVVAPAGSGKSRLLSHVARHYPGPVAWCGSPDPVPRSEASLVGWIARGMARITNFGEPPAGVGDLVRHPFPADAAPVLLLLDDVHLLEDSDAELSLSDLVGRLPRWMRLLLAARVSPNIDMSRLSVAGKVVEIGQDDLRFRTWEIEELFRNVYEEPLVPEDVGALARRTGGWAAYLQLFHLATARKPQRIRRQVIASLSSQSRLVQEYLSRHVLAELSPDLHDFLVRTSVLRRPTPELCDELLGWRTGSAERLAELERRQLFTERAEDGSYRYHTVLLSYLDALLVETQGIAAAREQHRHAAEMLERAGFSEDAIAAYAKSEDWESVGRVLRRSDDSDEQPATSPSGRSTWLEVLPPMVVSSDSLLLMAHGRLTVASGALEEAGRIMKDAEAVAASSTVAARCREERDRLMIWQSRDRVEVVDTSDWVVLLRAATQRNPSAIQRRGAQLGGVRGRFVEGMAALMAGEVKVAERVLRGVGLHPDAPAWMAAAAHLGAVGAAAYAGSSPDHQAVERLREEVELAGVPWLNRITSVALLAAGHDDDGVTGSLVEACERDGDNWGAALAMFLRGAAALHGDSTDTAAASLEAAANLFAQLEAQVLVATAAALHAVAAWRSGRQEEARKAATGAHALAGALEVPGACALAAVMLGLLNDRPRKVEEGRTALEQQGSWDRIARLTGTAGQEPDEVPSATAVATGEAATAPGAAEIERSSVSLRCLGGFSLTVGGTEIDESVAKPMERALLHLLALRAGEKVHREVILEALWPEAEPEAGRHRLQVAVSSLRRLLGDGSGGSPYLVRDGDTYRLDLPTDSDVDVWRVMRGTRLAAEARSRGEQPAEQAALEAVLAAYTGPLLPMDGPAEWVVGRRQSLQDMAAEAAGRLATIKARDGDLQGSLESARVGLAIDRYRDELWRMSIDLAERSGHHADAQRARRAYATVLQELGLGDATLEAPEPAAV